MEIEIDVSEVVRRLRLQTSDLQGKLEAAVAKGCLIVERDAKRLTPVQSGDLRRSVTHRVSVEGDEVKGEIGTNLFYAPYVELGTGIFATNGRGRKKGWAYTNEQGETVWTRGNRPQPFLLPALRQNEDKVKYTIANEIRKSLGGRSR